MNNYKIRYIILMVILVLSFIFSLLFFNRNNSTGSDSTDISRIPLNIPGWVGEELPIEADIKNILETNNVIMRRYANSKNDEIFLAIVYYRDSRVALHLPESCLMGHGSHLIERSLERIQIKGQKAFSANKLVIKNFNDSVSNLMMYYFETTNLCTASYLAFRKEMLLNKLKGLSANGALIRFSMVTQKNGASDQSASLREFIEEIGLILPQYLR